MPTILGLRCPPGALQWEAGERLVDCELPSNFLTIVAWTIGSESRADRGCFSVRHVVGDFVKFLTTLGSTELELGPRYDEGPVETGPHLCECWCAILGLNQ